MKDALSSLQKIVGSHGMVCLDTANNTILTSNHVQWATMKHDFGKNVGKFWVSYEPLAAYVRQIKGDISISLDSGTARFGNMGSYLRLPIDYEEKWTPLENIKYEYQQIIDLDVWKLMASIAEGNEARQEFRGVHLSHYGLVASHLGKVNMWARLDFKGAPNIVFPTQFINLFEDKAVLECAERMAKISTSAGVFESKLIDLTYPDIRQAIKDHPNFFTVDMDELRSAFKTTGIINDVVRVKVTDGAATVTATGKDGQTAQAKIDASGDPIELEFSAKQILMASQPINDSLTLQFTDSTSALRIDHDFYSCMIAGRLF